MCLSTFWGVLGFKVPSHVSDLEKDDIRFPYMRTFDTKR